MNGEIYDAGTLIVAAHKQGINLFTEDAVLLLTYMGVDDRHLMVDHDHNLSIRDDRSGMNRSELIPTDIHGVLMLAKEINAALIEYLTGKEDLSKEDKADLRGHKRDRTRLKGIVLE